MPGIGLSDNNRRESEADSAEYRRWLGTFSGGRLVVTRLSGHNVPIEQPALVMKTIRQVLQESRPVRVRMEPSP